MNFFDTIVKRVTNFSIQSYENNKENLVDFIEKNELFNLCVLTASSSLHGDIQKNKIKKVEGALYNYFIRAHFNPTPFGAFNSVGLLSWGDSTDIPKNDTLKVVVKYDNLFVSSKIKETFSEDWNNFSYCINPSICFLDNNKVGFYKSKHRSNDIIDLSYTEVDCDEDLLWLLDQFRDGKRIDLVVDQIITQGFEREEVETFLLETIDTGIILETFLFNSFASKLYQMYQPFLSQIVYQKDHLFESKKDVVKFGSFYLDEQKRLFNENEIPKNFYAINTFDTTGGTLSKDVKDKIRKFIDFTVHYNHQTTAINDNLEKFITQVKGRYNEGFVPLSDVLNPYSGIKYNEIRTENELKLHADIKSKILAAQGEELFLNLPWEDNFEIKRNKLPATFNVILESLICKKSGESVIYLHGLGDASSLNIISRFSDVTKNACEDIVNYEKEVNKDKIIADILCVGNFRSINIAPVKQYYDYVLPINTVYKEVDNPILLSDLHIHLHNNDFLLVSKKHQKQVLPKKVSAINQKLFDSDLYNFLCDYEFYRQEIYSVKFNFNAYQYCLPYVPRIYLEKGILLYPAQILLVYDNFSIEEFTVYLKQKIKQHNFSTKIIISERHRVVILDTSIKENIVLLLEKLKSARLIYICESLYEDFVPEIKGGDENFAHELVVGIQNPNYYRETVDYTNLDISKVKSTKAAVVSDWLYLEVYCNSFADSEVFAVIREEIILKNKTELFFFVNYFNPERHIRLRFRTNSIEDKQHIIYEVHKLKEKNIISTYRIQPYEQEIFRYGGPKMLEFSEKIFSADSRDYLLFVRESDEEELQMSAIFKIKNYLKFLNFSLDEMIDNCESVIKSYSYEFKLTSQLRKEFNREYASIKSRIEDFKESDFLNFPTLKTGLLENIKEAANLNINSYAWLLIHMSMNRHFKEHQRFNEFKMYYLTKCFLNQLKHKKEKVVEIE
ncbi:thiopeptide-type bacteriocin biosynthesis protein [uncultured Flavobacterium sp.]|uniref:thiopeptide-type bacteriocin biosynthesis protein n=1 Tax=uncultured Flavobacterium sp. TaxID=165435 RepID=UPI0025EC39C5|nr:thiopeptide-type bacteriocin biosynthesis protein [uncultured Flavobacterium sp.]